MDEKIEERGHWRSKTEFLLAVAGNIVGMGNVWRFPYLCYRNGGGKSLCFYYVIFPLGDLAHDILMINSCVYICYIIGEFSEVFLATCLVHNHSAMFTCSCHLVYFGVFSGVFLVPYLVFVVTCGIPLFLLEMAMGQYTQEGGITCWRRICPLAEGQ